MTMHNRKRDGWNVGSDMIKTCFGIRQIYKPKLKVDKLGLGRTSVGSAMETTILGILEAD